MDALFKRSQLHQNDTSQLSPTPASTYIMQHPKKKIETTRNLPQAQKFDRNMDLSDYYQSIELNRNLYVLEC